MRTIFVDGYNVINTWTELKTVKEYNYDAARQKLIDILQNYSTYNGYKVLLVFDAHMVIGGLQKKERLGNLIIIFTKEGETADSYIEKTINNLGNKVDVCVVTSDSLEQQVTFQRGAIRMSSIEFYHEVRRIEESIKVRTENKYSEKRNLLQDRIQQDVLEKLEKIRRSR